MTEDFSNYLDDGEIDFGAYYRASEASAHVRQAGVYVDDLVADMKGDPTMSGHPMPYGKLHGRFHLRPREVTGWVGYKGHAKSAIISDVIAAEGARGRTALIISPEFPALKVLARKCRQCAASAEPSDRYIRAWSSWANKWLWVFDKQSKLTPELVLGVVAYGIRELNVDHIVVDSLMKCGIRGHDGALYSAQADFVDRLQHLVHGSERTHLHLVLHARKGMDDRKAPNPHDARGAGEMVDQLENILVVHMNKEKQIKRTEGDEPDDSHPDVTLTVEAQRNATGGLGRYGLWFAPGMRFVGRAGDRADPYFDIEQAEIEA